MSPDSRLTAAERAALADLEAAAAAADPHLASRLQGSKASRFAALATTNLPDLGRFWRRVLSLRLWGILPTIVGLVLVVLGLSAGMGLAIFGALLTTVGLMILAHAVEVRITRRLAEREATPQSD